MKKTHFKLVLTATVSTVLMLSGTTAVSANDLRIAGVQPSVIGEVSADTDGMYIVRLSDPAIAIYDGGIAGYPATSAKANGNRRLNTKSKAAKKYEKYLRDQQKELLGNAGVAFGRGLDTKFEYQHAINGFAVELTAVEAKAMRSMDGVASVQRERMEHLLTDVGPSFIGAPSIWTNPPDSTQGEGVVIAVLDTGINSDHPSFADIGGDSYNHDNPLGSGNYIPGSYCDVTDPGFCNDKLIGAWDFVDVDGDVPEDDDGHGSHTTSTAAGNVVLGAELVASTTSAFFDISGVARHANIIAYDVCFFTPTGGSCPGSALVAAIDQVLIDAGNLPNGIAALNYSISGGGDPYNDTVELGFLAAVAAGVYVSASAGNSGPGPSTVTHLGPWVSTTAASTHNRNIINSLIDTGSDGGGIADILGAGFTSGYGPATIVHANTEAVDPAGQCLVPFAPGTWTAGEIVVCDRGTIARVAKGANVLAGGAGGFVLANLDAQGESVVGDAHFLPAVHIGDTDGDVLRTWLAANTSTVATISGFSIDLSPANGDIMAGFSSRGPQTAFDVLKPDVTAPGVDIMAANADGFGLGDPEYQIISGTSMSSPHNAGAGALMTALHPDWLPQEIKSALMMTSTTEFTVKEDGATPTDPFDLGAGRLALGDAKDAGLIMHESIANFLAANPDLGGDPSSLNVASMQNSACVGKCKWKRTVTGVNSGNNMFDISTSGPAGLGLTLNPASGKIVVGKNKSKEIIVTADTTFATPGWNFANLHIEPQGSGPDLHMPIAVFASDTTNGNLLNKSVDKTSDVEAGDILTYEISITNGQMAGEIELEDAIPAGTTFVADSETEVIVDGTTFTPFDFSGGSMTWTGELDTGGLVVDTSVTSPAGYLPLSIFTSPVGFPGNCDDGAFVVNVPAFTFNGVTYGSVIWSVNGTVEVGTASGVPSSFDNQNLPDPTSPNNILAPFWRDLNGCAGGDLYVIVLAGGGGQWLVLEWTDIPFFGDPAESSFQVWIGTDASAFGNTIHYTYGKLDDTSSGATVGVENATGTVGDSYFFNGVGTPPAVGTDLEVFTTIGGTATFGFSVTVDECADPGIVNEAQISNHGDKERAIATSTCD